MTVIADNGDMRCLVCILDVIYELKKIKNKNFKQQASTLKSLHYIICFMGEARIATPGS